MSRAPGRSADGGNTQPVRLIGEDGTKVQVPWSRPVHRDTTAGQDLRTHLIALTAYPYPAVHYHVRWVGARSLQQSTQTLFEDAPGGPSPAGVQQSDGPARRYQVDGDTVRHRDGEKDAGRTGDPPVNSFDLSPTLGPIDPSHVGAVHLIAQHNCSEVGTASPEGEPPTHDLTHRLATPETKVKSSSGLGAPPGDPGNRAVPLPPGRDFESGDVPRNGDLRNCAGWCDVNLRYRRTAPLLTCPAALRSSHPPARSRRRARANAHRYVRIPARSARHYGWCSPRRQRARRAAWPCRRECRGTRRSHL